MSWVETIKIVDCESPSTLLAGATITDGYSIYYSDANGQFIAIVDDAYTAYGVQISKGSYTSLTYVLTIQNAGTIQTVCLHKAPPPPPTCFTGDTLVTLADGMEQPISLVRKGDFILGRSGQPNRVIGIERPLLGDRRLYALNGSAPFVTAEHPFLTEAGWKAIDPAATAAENPRLVVERLAVKDVLLKLQGCAVPVGSSGSEESLEPILEAMLLVRLEARRADPGTQLYNLLLDGDHAYFANGFLVHNKTTGPSCFIVSAATGSPQSEEISQLRTLRDRVAGASRLGAQLIDAIYDEYVQFSPGIAVELEGDEMVRQTVLWIVVRPLLAWYALAGKLAFEHGDQDAIRQAAQNVRDACPAGASSFAAVLEALRAGAPLPEGTPQAVHGLAPKVRAATGHPRAAWAILDPLTRLWRSASDPVDLIDQVSQWLATAPVDSLKPPSTPGELDAEVGALAEFFCFKPNARRQLGERLTAAWPKAAETLKRHGFA